MNWHKIKDIMVFVFAILVASSMLYIVFEKALILFNY